MSATPTNKQTIYLNTSFRVGGTVQAPFWSLPSSLISNTDDDETLHLTVIDILIPFNSYNLYSYPDAIYFPDRIKTQNVSFTLGVIDWQLQVAPLPNPMTNASSPANNFTIPMGNYNVLDLALIIGADIQTYLRTTLGVPAAQNLTVVCTYDFILMKYIINFAIPAIDGRMMNTSPPVINFPTIDGYTLDVTAWEWMGGNPSLPQRDLVTTTAPAIQYQKYTLTSFGFGNCAMPKSVVLKLDLISGNIGLDGNALGHTTTMSTIPVNVANGETITYQNVNDDFMLAVPSHYLDTIQMEILDNRGRPLFTNQDFQLSFRVDYVKVDHSNEKLLTELIYLTELNVMGIKEVVESTEPEQSIANPT